MTHRTPDRGAGVLLVLRMAYQVGIDDSQIFTVKQGKGNEPVRHLLLS